MKKYIKLFLSGTTLMVGLVFCSFSNTQTAANNSRTAKEKQRLKQDSKSIPQAAHFKGKRNVKKLTPDELKRAKPQH